MPNLIDVTQNEILQLQRLAAQSYLYSKAKSLKILQSILSIPGVLVFSGLVAIYPGAKVWAALYGLSVAVLDATVIDKKQKELRNLAAKIQELFDCDVLKLEWNKLLLRLRPEHEVILENAAKYQRVNSAFEKLRDWYPVSLNKLPLPLARLVCQRANCWWDMNLRRRYSQGVVIVSIILAVIVFLIGLIGGMTLEKFILAVLAPLMPLFLWAIREYREQSEAAEEQTSLKSSIEEVWDSAISKNISTRQVEETSRRIQDKIYMLRRNNPSIFDWIYNALRDKREAEMNRAAEFFVEEALKSKNL